MSSKMHVGQLLVTPIGDGSDANEYWWDHQLPARATDTFVVGAPQSVFVTTLDTTQILRVIANGTLVGYSVSGQNVTTMLNGVPFEVVAGTVTVEYENGFSLSDITNPHPSVHMTDPTAMMVSARAHESDFIAWGTKVIWDRRADPEVKADG